MKCHYLWISALSICFSLAGMETSLKKTDPIKINYSKAELVPLVLHTLAQNITLSVLKEQALLVVPQSSTSIPLLKNLPKEPAEALNEALHRLSTVFPEEIIRKISSTCALHCILSKAPKEQKQKLLDVIVNILSWYPQWREKSYNLIITNNPFKLNYIDPTIKFLERMRLKLEDTMDLSSPLAKGGFSFFIDAYLPNAPLPAQANSARETILHLAAIFDAKEIISLLFSLNVNPNVQDTEGFTPLHYAATSGEMNVLPLLDTQESRLSYNNCHHATPLELAIAHNQLDVVKHLLKVTNFTAIEAIRERIIATTLLTCTTPQIASLVRQKLEETSIYSTLSSLVQVHFAIACHDTPLSENSKIGSLLKTYCNESEQKLEGTRLLHTAVRFDNKEAVSFLVKEPVELNAPDWDRNTPLHIAASEGNDAIIKDLVACGADLEALDISNVNPLFCAIRRHHCSTAELLIAYNSSLRSEHLTALHMATSHKQLPIIKLLVEKDPALVNVRDSHQQIPLHAYVRFISPFMEVFTLFCENNVELDAQDSVGNTPLHIAALRGNLEAVKALLTQGASTDITNNDGKKAIDIAAPPIQEFLSTGALPL
jgi:ankyrin repeat protein